MTIFLAGKGYSNFLTERDLALIQHGKLFLTYRLLQTIQRPHIELDTHTHLLVTQETTPQYYKATSFY